MESIHGSYCPQCGGQVQDGDAFCDNCGKPLSQASLVAKSDQQSSVNPMLQPISGEFVTIHRTEMMGIPSGYSNGYVPPSAPLVQKNRKMRLLLGAVVLFFALLGGYTLGDYLGLFLGEGVRLSQLEFTVPFGYQSDVKIDQWEKGQFSVNGTKYTNGLGYRTMTYVTDEEREKVVFEFNLEKKYSKLTGVLGVDDASKAKNDIMLWRIYKDGVLAYESKTMKAGEGKSVRVNISGCQKLSIEMRKVTANDEEPTSYGSMTTAPIQPVFADAMLYE